MRKLCNPCSSKHIEPEIALRKINPYRTKLYISSPTTPIKLYLVTYNVKSNNPDEDLDALLAIPPKPAGAPSKTDYLPDFYVLSFQEVKSNAPIILMDSVSNDQWAKACVDKLKPRGYVKVKCAKWQGLLLIIFALKRHLLNIRELDVDYIKAGCKGIWGNKGAISIRFGFYGCSICFVNSHLSAHDHNLKQRIIDYNNIIENQEFNIEECSLIFYHDYVFWMGDLNFRLAEDFDKSAQEIENTIKENKLDLLFQQDQLKAAMAQNKAFSELTEQKITFPPTFKFQIGTNDYNLKRRPAWCDRILYTINTNNYENNVLFCTQNSYQSIPSYNLSDHKPVAAEFTIKVFTDYSKRVITFENIVSWDCCTNNKAFYKTAERMATNKEDWIGLFKEDFGCLDEYVTYEYVRKCSVPIARKTRSTPKLASKSASSSLTRYKPVKSSSSTLGIEQTMRYKVTFGELPIQSPGNYCLVYVSQMENKVISVLGMSNNFPVKMSVFDLKKVNCQWIAHF